jgi:hypothetical protein
MLERSGSLRALDGVRRSLAPQALDAEQSEQYSRYLEGTLTSLDRMRSPNGLIVDKVQAVRAPDGAIRYEVLNPNTSPTNIGLDLLIQLELLGDPRRSGDASRNLARTIETLEKMPRHPETGLYYSWYEAGSAEPRQKNVSSVDNVHLALALWAASKSAPDAKSKARAERLFQKMDFSEFLDARTGLIGGNLQHQLRDGKETWFREPWNYSNYGAEARSIYSLSHGLGLMRKAGSDSVLENAPKNLKVEIARTSEGEVLRTWDGGAFQLMLPRLLIREDQYSPGMGRIFQNYGAHVLAQQKRESLPVPAAYSACNFGVDDEPARFSGVPSYVGKAGTPGLVSADHQEFRDAAHRKDWDRVVTPHAVFLAAATNPAAFSAPLRKAERVGADEKLYDREVGWMDGVHVRHEHRGKVIPVQLSLDQSMIALSLLEMRAPDNRTTASRLLGADPMVHSRLQSFYSAMEPRLSGSAARSE